MHFSSLLAFLAAGSACVQALAISKTPSQQDFGVGFSLSIDYAVASIYYPDGSYMDLVKTEGSPDYRELMKRAGRDSLAMRPPTDDIASPQSSIHIPETQAALQSRLSHWFDIKERNAGMVEMFQALKVATEAYLQRPIETVDVTTPFPLSPSLESSLISAYQATSLHYARSPQLAGALATRYEGLVGSCSGDLGHRDDPAQLLVAVDWNRAALTLTILEENCGSVTWRRVAHDEKLGDLAMKKCQAQYDEKHCDGQLKTFISKALEPLNDDRAPGFIQTMLLVGEYSMSNKIMWLVKDQLKDQYPASLASNPTNKFRQHVQPVNPVFAAARAAAWDSWSIMSLSRNVETHYDEKATIEL